MFRFVFVALSAVFVFSVFDVSTALSSAGADDADPDTNDNGIVEYDSEDRIASGSAATIAMYPYQISLQNQKGAHICGGCIISKSSILTAANCVQGMTPASLRIRAGSRIWNQYGALRNISKIKIHPYYNAVTDENDLAVLTLVSPLIFTDKINKVILATETPENGERVIATGWAKQYAESSGLPVNLQQVVLDFIRNANCSQNYSYAQSRIKPGMVCAGEDGKATCQGDSGGPLVHKSTRKLVGIASTTTGVGCARMGYPGIFTNTATRLAYILQSL